MSFIRFIAALIYLCGNTALANTQPSPLSLKGFGTFSTVGTDTDALYYRRDILQTPGVNDEWGLDVDSRLGLQADLMINQHWHAAMQWVARNISGNFFEQNLDWFFLRWQNDHNLSVRLGRLGLDVFLLPDYRSVGYAFLWARPPQQFYAGLPANHFDGLDIAQKYLLDDGVLTIKGFAGHSFLQPPTFTEQTSDQSITLTGIKLMYESGNWTSRISYAYVHNNLEISALQPLLNSLADPSINAVWPNAQNLIQHISNIDTDLHYASLGMSYDDSDWLAQSEFSYVYSDLATYSSQLSGYLSLGKRFNKLTLYSLFSFAKSLKNHVDISEPLLPIPSVVELK